MKKLKAVFLTAIALATLLLGCEKVEFILNANPEEYLLEDDPTSNVIIRTNTGHSSAVGVIYVQKGLLTGLTVRNRRAAGSPVTEATWSIEGKTYTSIQAWHKFTNLGQVNVSVLLKFQNGSSETRRFRVISVVNISQGDPVKSFVTNNNNATWNVLLLFSKERLKHATDTNFFFTGNVNSWQQTIISPAHKRYVINATGQPELTNGAGQYVGVNLTMTSSLGVHNIALIHSAGLWADFSGSVFIKDANPGLAWFSFHNGVLTPQGDNYAKNLPGEIGDAYFRFTQVGNNITGRIILFFKLESNFTSSAFVVRQLGSGAYTNPIRMQPVSGFSEWGQIELPATEMHNRVVAFRYGPNISQPEIYSGIMIRSFFYDPFYKDLRVEIGAIY